MSALLEILELHPVRIPMRHRFRRVDHREAVLIKGPSGWGEFSPFPDYPPQVTTRWLASALEAACSILPEPERGEARRHSACGSWNLLDFDALRVAATG